MLPTQWADLDALELAKRKYVQDLDADPSSLSLGRSDVWINPSTGIFCWGPPCPMHDFPADITSILLPLTSLNTGKWVPLIPFHCAEFVEEYFQYALQEDADNFLKVSSRAGTHMTIDPYSTCYLGSILGLNTQMVIGHIPILLESDISQESWRIFDSPWNKSDPLQRMSGGWLRAPYGFSRGFFTGPSTFRCVIYLKDEVKQTWIVQSPRFYEQMKLADPKFDNLVMMCFIWYQVEIAASTADTLPPILYSRVPPLFLFLPPIEKVWAHGRVLIRVKPNCSPFWSLDPLGQVKIKEMTARLLGIPPIQFTLHTVYIAAHSPLRKAIGQFLKDHYTEPNDYPRSRGWPEFQIVPEFNQVVEQGRPEYVKILSLIFNVILCPDVEFHSVDRKYLDAGRVAGFATLNCQ
ncbi:hypothetical protein GYMLUDRAFT_248282 [Collybiopsis luxurians FD-317 M1]|uniref:Uncharacterized protein n=1 Tax=Collybiopsis luxurians FD-317 M1 TaxID=944289 RepID=A0A0D0CCT9_9AGAR|nr:hypothetical protein GYMLUDRAFT_248282 [Collybiopsis luxurians FD-317 M1]